MNRVVSMGAVVLEAGICVVPRLFGARALTISFFGKLYMVPHHDAVAISKFCCPFLEKR